MQNKFRQEQNIIQRYSEKTDTWSFQVRIRTDKISLTKTFSSKKYGSARIAFNQAVLFRDKKTAEITAGMIMNEPEITLDQCFNESLDLFNFRYKTKRNHISLYERYIKSDMLVKDLNNAYALKCMNKMTDTCSDELIRRVYSIFKDIDRTALYNNYYNTSHITYLKPPQSHRIGRFRDERITDKQTLEKVISLIQSKIKDQYECKLFINALWTMYYTGCRPGEILALNKEDVRNGWIYINKEIGSSTEEEYTLRPPKNRESYRKIPIAKKLSQYLDDMNQISRSDTILFADRNGRYMYSNLFGSRIQSYLRRTDIRFNCYMLRHLFQTDLRYSGVDDKTIDVLVGHSNRRTIDIYTHTDDERLKNAIFLRKECVHMSNFSTQN